MKPIVVVEVSGGCAYIHTSGDVEVELLDWDNLNAELPSYWRQRIGEVLEVIRPYATEGDNQETFTRLVEELERERMR